MTNLGGHDMETVLEAFHAARGPEPTCFIAYTVKGMGLPFAEHKDNHAGLMNPDQMAQFQRTMAIPAGQEWEPFVGLDLPAETIEVEYALEYGTATLEIHRDAIQPGQRVLIVDDLLATGGTVMGTIELVQRLGGEVAGLAFMVELSALHGRERLGNFSISTLLAY